MNEHHMMHDLKMHLKQDIAFVAKLLKWNNILTGIVTMFLLGLVIFFSCDNRRLHSDNDRLVEIAYQEKLNSALGGLLKISVQDLGADKQEITSYLHARGADYIPWIRIRTLRGWESGNQQFDLDGSVHCSTVADGLIGIGLHQITLSARGYNKLAPVFMNGGWNINSAEGNRARGIDIFIGKYKTVKPVKGETRLDAATRAYNGSGKRTFVYLKNIRQLEKVIAEKVKYVNKR